jgi:aminomethyltransferase
VDFATHFETTDVAELVVGQAHSSTILNDRGTIEDDCLVYRAEDHIMMVVNASNAAKDFAHISRHIDRFDATLEDVSDATALLALQGPKAAEILQRHTDTDLSAIKYYHFTFGTVAGIEGIVISRTGYTGEDGFELYFANENAVTVWNALTESGEVMPAGLGCRDSLRLEMGMALYGNDIDDTVTPLEANLQWLMKLKKGQMTDTPVQTNHGWHVIRLDDERPTKVPPYDAVKQNLQQQLMQQSQKQVYDKTLADLRAKAKIENP